MWDNFKCISNVGSEISQLVPQLAINEAFLAFLAKQLAINEAF